MSEILSENLEIIEKERYEYSTEKGKTVLFQRLNRDHMWYVIYNNQIINHGQYRHDLEQWCDLAL